MAETKDYSKQKAGTTISPTKFGRLLEKLGFKEGLNFNQKLMKPVQMSIKAVDQALKAAKWVGAGRLVAAQAVYALATSDTRSPTKDTDRGSPSKSSKVVDQKMMAAQMNLATRRAKKIKEKEDNDKNKKPMKRPSGIFKLKRGGMARKKK
jgi:hypothetical protein|tara:strand:+ start:51 stop:503 length:453 start_codon:yes stop_codon:yes gene_type:complete